MVYITDLVLKIRSSKLIISSFGVTKLAGSTEFKSAKSSLDNFQSQFPLSLGEERTLQGKFFRLSQIEKYFLQRDQMMDYV
jgi:hypothetical protein